MPYEISRDPLACRVRWHPAGCVVITYSDGEVRHEVNPPQPISRTCVRCGQLTITSADPLCELCKAIARQPQGEPVRLFEPAPAQIPGQLSL